MRGLRFAHFTSLKGLKSRVVGHVFARGVRALFTIEIEEEWRAPPSLALTLGSPSFVRMSAERPATIHAIQCRSFHSGGVARVFACRIRECSRSANSSSFVE